MRRVLSPWRGRPLLSTDTYYTVSRAGRASGPGPSGRCAVQPGGEAEVARLGYTHDSHLQACGRAGCGSSHPHEEAGVGGEPEAGSAGLGWLCLTT